MADFNIPGLKDAIAEFTKLNDVVDQTAEKLLKAAVDADKAMQPYKNNSGLKDYVELQKKAGEEQKKTKVVVDQYEKAQEKLKFSQSELAKQIAAVNVQTQQQNQINKAAAQSTELVDAALKKQATSIAEARAQNALFTQARNSANISTVEGKARLLELNDALDKNNAFIKDNADSALKQKLNIGAYAEGMQTALEKTGLYDSKLGGLAKTAIGFVQTGAQAVTKLKEINDTVTNSIKGIVGYGTASKTASEAQEAMALVSQAETVANEENLLATNANKAAKIGFTVAEKASTVATEASVITSKAATGAAEGMAVAQVGLTATSEGLAVGSTTAAAAVGILDVALGILLSPITLIIAAAAGLIFIFKDFAPIVNPIKDIFAALGAIFSTIKQDIFDLITGARSLTDIFTNFGGSMKEAANSAMELAAAEREVAKAQDINDVAMAQAQTRVQALILQSKNRTLTEKERIELIQKAQTIEENAFKKTNELNNRAIDNARKKLFEGKVVSEQEQKFIEANDYAKIRSLKIVKNLDEDELKSYKDLLLKKEELAKQDQQIQEKAQNRKDALADKQEKEAEKAKDDAQKEAEKQEKRAEEAAKNELERRKKSLELVISTKKTALDYTIASYKQDEHAQDDNLAHVKAVSLEKQQISQLEAQKELVGVKKNSLDYQNILAKSASEAEKIKLEEVEAVKKIQQEGAEFQLELYDLNHDTLIDGSKDLTDLLIDEEKRRMKESLQVHKDYMREELGIDKDLSDEKLKEMAKNNEKLTANQLKYLQGILKMDKETDDKIKANDELLVKAKLKAIDTEEKDSVKKYKQLQKGTLANNIFQLKAEETRIKAELKLQKGNAKEEERLEKDLAANKMEFQNLIRENKEENLRKGFALASEILGNESDLAKAFAIAQILIDTYKSASKLFTLAGVETTKALASTAEYDFAGAAAHTAAAATAEVTGGLTIAEGAVQAAKVAGIAFETGTLFAPYTGKAIGHEKGAELHFDSNWNLKSLGSDKGAQAIDIVQGDKIIPADISAMIKSTLFASYGMSKSENFSMSIDYEKIGEQVAKFNQSSTNKIVTAIKNSRSNTSIHITKDNHDKARFIGRKV